MSIINTDNLKSILSKFKEKIYTSINKNTEDIKQLSNPNLLINGDFQVWQRGEEFTDDKEIYIADRWRLYYYTYADGMKISNDNYGMLVSYDGTENPSMLIGNISEGEKLSKLYGKPLTLSLEYEVLLGNPNLSIEIRNDSPLNNYGAGVDRITSSISKHSTDKQGTLITTMNALKEDYQTLISCFIISNINNEPFKILIKHVKLEVGEFVTPFISRSYGDELQLCKRYYEKYPTACFGILTQSVIEDYTPGISFEVEKRIAPTIKIYSEINNEGYVHGTTTGKEYEASPEYISSKGFRQIHIESLPINTTVGFSYTANAEIY